MSVWEPVTGGVRPLVSPRDETQDGVRVPGRLTEGIVREAAGVDTRGVTTGVPRPTVPTLVYQLARRLHVHFPTHSNTS